MKLRLSATVCLYSPVSPTAPASVKITSPSWNKHPASESARGDEYILSRASLPWKKRDGSRSAREPIPVKIKTVARRRFEFKMLGGGASCCSDGGSGGKAITTSSTEKYRRLQSESGQWPPQLRRVRVSSISQHVSTNGMASTVASATGADSTCGLAILR